MRYVGKKLLVHILVAGILASLLCVTILVSAAPAPTISSVNPNQGVQGQTLTSVIITGNNFNGATGWASALR
jgi:hypothetical protein